MREGLRKRKRQEQLHLFSDFALECLADLNNFQLERVFEEIATNNIRADLDAEQWNLVLSRILNSNYQYQAFFMTAIKRIANALDEYSLLSPNNRKAIEAEQLGIDEEENQDEEEGFHETPPTSPGGQQIMLYIEPGDANAQDIADLYLALASYYRAVGGSGLKITNEGCRTLIEMEAI